MLLLEQFVSANRRAAISPRREGGRPFLDCSSRSAPTITRAVAGQGLKASIPPALMQAATLGLLNQT